MPNFVLICSLGEIRIQERHVVDKNNSGHIGTASWLRPKNTYSSVGNEASKVGKEMRSVVVLNADTSMEK